MPAFFDCYREIIPDFPLFQESLREPLPKHLRVNRIKAEPSQIIEGLVSRGILVEKIGGEDDLLVTNLNDPGNLLEYTLGYIHPQALTSILASLALDAQKNSFVLDLCASPGGKTAHLAQMMGNTGLVIANELYARRRIPLGHTLARLGVTNAVLTGYPAQEFPMKQAFDYVLADVPCSGEGRFRFGSPVSRYEERGYRFKLQQLQTRAIVRGFDLLKPGGVMLYSTCTYDPAENESVVDHLLKKRPADLLPIRLGFKTEPGLTSWKGDSYDARVERTFRFYPHRVNSVGFFMARISKG